MVEGHNCPLPLLQSFRYKIRRYIVISRFVWPVARRSLLRIANVLCCRFLNLYDTTVNEVHVAVSSQIHFNPALQTVIWVTTLGDKPKRDTEMPYPF